MKYLFSKPEYIDRFNYSKLSEVQQKQLPEAMKEAVGKTSLIDGFKEGEEMEMFWWEFYTIKDSETGKVVYDAWMLSEENGTLFNAGTADQAGIHIIQFDFHDVSAENREELLEQLDEAYRKADHVYYKDGEHDVDEYSKLEDAFLEKLDSTNK